jgi:hypothetical protein
LAKDENNTDVAKVILNAAENSSPLDNETNNDGMRKRK